MGFNCGIVGLPNVGKSTLFNALTNTAKAQAENYPFCTIEPNIGIVEVPDERLYRIANIVKPKKITPTTIEFVDIAGLVKGASKGEGLGNQFLANIRNVDAIAQVVRCFEDKNVVHVEGSVNPKRDMEIVNLELILKDLETVEKRLNSSLKRARSGDKSAKNEVRILEHLKQTLESGKRAYMLTDGLSIAEERFLKELCLLTSKPMMYIANVGEDNTENKYIKEVERIAKTENAAVVKISAKVESELSELNEDEKIEFLSELGMKEPGLNAVIREGYKLLDLVTFFTAGEPEVRAWTVKGGTKAPEAAGKIHTDIERGFIRAEVTKYNDLIREGSMQTCKEKGLMHLEGKSYEIQDGDIVYFRFNI